MRVLSLLLIALILSSGLSAKELFMANITNDEDEQYFKYYLIVDDANEITAFIKKSWKNISYYKSQPTKPKYVKKYPAPDGRAGTISLEQRRGTDIIKMVTENFDRRTGADLKLKYVYYGWDLEWDRSKADKHFKVEMIKLERDENGRYFLSQNGKEFKHMHFKMRTDKRLFWGILPAGIKDAEMSMTPFRN